jgi:hypothetical protein
VRLRIAILMFMIMLAGTACRRAPVAEPATRNALAEAAPPPPFICAGVRDPKSPADHPRGLGGDRGGPCTVAADDALVFLGWRGAEHGQEIVAVDPAGTAQWSHHHAEGLCGLRALAADAGVLFVLGGVEGPDSDGGSLYKLDARTGAPLTWKTDGPTELKITTLWGEGQTEPTIANALAARNGRVYLTFTAHGFIAVLDAESGAYVTTLTAPEPAQMALSTTPMLDPDQPGSHIVLDFGVCALAHHGIAYFVMNHEPAWVRHSTTRWLRPDEGIVAFTMRGDTMRSGDVTLYTALGAPQHQVQLRPVEAAEGFSVTVGEAGGRPARGPWKGEALRDVRALAVDATGQLWIAEGTATPKRFSVWKTDAPRGVLVREIFGPLDVDEPAFRAEPPDTWLAQGCRWRIDPATGAAQCLEVLGEDTTLSR